MMSFQAAVIRYVLRNRFKKQRFRFNPDRVQKHMNRMMRFVPEVPADVAVEPVDGINARWFIPNGAHPDKVLLYLHGGGYNYCSPETHRDLIRRLGQKIGVRVLASDYRLAPKHPFPAAVEDAVAAYRFLFARNPRAADIALAGDSAGGGLAFALLVSLRDAGIPLPCAVAALSPWTDLTCSGPTLTLNEGADPMLHPSILALMVQRYMNGRDPAHPLASPLFATLEGFPPTLIHVGDSEILRSDSERMAECLRAKGVSVELEVWKGMPHVWHFLAHWMPESRKAITKVSRFLGKHLGM